ncbi:hypothetical protein [Streptomyces sennicomposti]
MPDLIQTFSRAAVERRSGLGDHAFEAPLAQLPVVEPGLRGDHVIGRRQHDDKPPDVADQLQQQAAALGVEAVAHVDECTGGLRVWGAQDVPAGVGRALRIWSLLCAELDGILAVQAHQAAGCASGIKD